MTLENLRKAFKEEQLIYGSERTIKKLKQGKTKTIFLAKNCPPDVRATIQHYATLQPVTIHDLEEPNTELALICKKKYNVSVVSY
ncbi:MAG TPA: ribosomal L7Ae/L30e/S12e/Gadd45 family protein [Candidatus Nanoarchaeia archaeon]|nr:ribosomal L7Ae/L30e/S12e/Gadd45 family protein [Candidatus Nanoarchaeia archaeon]